VAGRPVGWFAACGWFARLVGWFAACGWFARLVRPLDPPDHKISKTFPHWDG